MPAIVMLLPRVAMLIMLLVSAAARSSPGAWRRRRVLHLRDVHLRADVSDLHHGLGGRAGAARGRVDAAHRRAARRSPVDRRSARRRDRSASSAARSSSATSPSATRASGREPALRDIDLTVPAGTTLGVVGPVGSGKSTLASLIPRLYEVEDGQLFIGGIDINRIPLRRAALEHRDGAPGLLPVLDDPGREHRLRAARADDERGPPRGRRRAARQGRRRAARRLRHRGGRARRDALGRPAPAHGPGARARACDPGS